MSTSPPSSPFVTIELGNSRIDLLGTAHVSRISAEEVEALLDTGDYQAVAVELCPSRYHALIQPDALAQMDLLAVFRQGKTAMIIASLVMSAYQQRLAEQLGVEPGAEQRKAIEMANKHHLPILLIDREIGITLKRTAASLSWWKRWTLFSGLLVSLFSNETIEEDAIEKLKEGDILETAFAEFAHERQDLFKPLIAERDEYMAARLVQEIDTHHYHRVLAVVGAGHIPGLKQALHLPLENPTQRLAELMQHPPASNKGKRLAWAIAALVLLGFVVGFVRSPELGWNLVSTWILINGGFAAVGTVLAGAHPLSTLTAFLAAPLTSLNPTIGAGLVTAMTEFHLRKPKVQDFEQLRHDTTHWMGWWKNRVSRILLVFVFSTLGSAIGTYVAGFQIVDKLTGG